MKQLSKLCIALLFSTFTMSATAQQVYKGQIDVKSAEMLQKGDSLYINMEMNLEKLKLSHNRYLTLTPILTGAEESKELGDVLINGRTRNKSYDRSMALDKKQLDEYKPEKVLKSNKKNNKNTLHYTQAVAYEPWMQGAQLTVREVLCGCGGHDEEIAETKIVEKITYAVPPTYDVKPLFAFAQPNAEATKAREDQFELYLNFPVNKTNILPNYLDNAQELAQLKTALTKINSDNYLDVQQINIVGYASPEGGIANNEKLSKGRAEALKQYLVPKLKYPASAYSVAYGGENWTGLIEAVEQSTFTDKEEILDLLKNTSDVTARKNKLKAYKKGVPYRSMLTDIYPRLRKVILGVQYNVEHFSLENAKEILKTRPDLLSPSELYQIANTYPEGSAEFVNAIETAAKLFPKDETANLNAAAIALSKNDLPLAESYLSKVNPESGEYANNMGVLHLLKGDLEQAKAEFDKASKKGVTAAKDNLKEVEKKYEIEVLKKLR